MSRCVAVVLMVLIGCGEPGPAAVDAGADPQPPRDGTWPAAYIAVGASCAGLAGFCGQYLGWCHIGTCRKFCSPVDYPRCKAPLVETEWFHEPSQANLCVCS